MGVSYIRRQESCAKVIFKPRSSAGTEHKASAGAFETTSRIANSLLSTGLYVPREKSPVSSCYYLQRGGYVTGGVSKISQDIMKGF